MINHLHPTANLLKRMSERGTYWPDVESDLLKTETVTPVAGFHSRLRLAGENWQGYVEPGKSEGHWVLVGVRPRERAEQGQHEPVIGVEVSRSIPRSSGGSGRRWPSSWSELQGRLIEQGYRLEQGRNHIGVYDGERRVSTLPVTASDHRALVNACTQLRREADIDVRR